MMCKICGAGFRGYVLFMCSMYLGLHHSSIWTDAVWWVGGFGPCSSSLLLGVHTTLILLFDIGISDTRPACVEPRGSRYVRFFEIHSTD